MPSEVLPRFIDDDYLPEEDDTPIKAEQPKEEDETGFWASKKTAIICAIIIVIVLIIVIVYIVYTQKKKNVHKSNAYNPVSINPRRNPPPRRPLTRPKQRPQPPKKKVHFEDESEPEEDPAVSSGDEKDKMIEEMNMENDEDFEDVQSRKDDELVMDKFMEESMEVSDNIELNDILQEHDNEDDLSDDNSPPSEVSKQCAFVPATGKNKGIRCEGIAINGLFYCNKHKYVKK